MQRTRLSTLLDTAGNRLTAFAGNPWRRLSLLALSLFIGFFIGASVSTAAGQRGVWDVIASIIIILITETISSLFYSRLLGRTQLAVWLDVLNVFKIGLMYSLFLEAFKLGS